MVWSQIEIPLAPLVGLVVVPTLLTGALIHRFVTVLAVSRIGHASVFSWQQVLTFRTENALTFTVIEFAAADIANPVGGIALVHWKRYSSFCPVYEAAIA